MGLIVNLARWGAWRALLALLAYFYAAPWARDFAAKLSGSEGVGKCVYAAVFLAWGFYAFRRRPLGDARGGGAGRGNRRRFWEEWSDSRWRMGPGGEPDNWTFSCHQFKLAVDFRNRAVAVSCRYASVESAVGVGAVDGSAPVAGKGSWNLSKSFSDLPMLGMRCDVSRRPDLSPSLMGDVIFVDGDGANRRFRRPGAHPYPRSGGWDSDCDLTITWSEWLGLPDAPRVAEPPAAQPEASTPKGLPPGCPDWRDYYMFSRDTGEKVPKAGVSWEDAEAAKERARHAGVYWDHGDRPADPEASTGAAKKFDEPGVGRLMARVRIFKLGHRSARKFETDWALALMWIQEAERARGAG